METKDIFAKLKKRMLDGMVFHDEMVRYYSFLNLEEYQKVHELHYREESKGYRELCDYYMNHYNMLIPTEPMSRPDVIPENWYKHKRQDVDRNTKQNAVKTGIEKWVKWETETKDHYQDLYLSLIENGDAAAAKFVSRYVMDVDQELKYAQCNHLILESIGYDLTAIISKGL